ncbi:MAG: prephenate dehydratase [Thermodesulfobacteriota bacterium]
MSAAGIKELREQVDRLDREILDLLNRRAGLSLEIGRLKHEEKRAIHDPGRERDLIEALARGNRGPLSAEGLRRVYTEIVSACRSLQGRTRVACLGPAGTFSHAAALAHFGGSVEVRPLESIDRVFGEVEGGRADYGVVPVENSTEGTVGLTLDRFLSSDLGLCGEVCLGVSLALLSRATGLAGVRRVLSHPQALAQCRAWLDRRLPGAVRVDAASTAAAAEAAAGDQEAAAVGSPLLADIHGLAVLAEDIQDLAGNQTRFAVIGRDRPSRTGRDKTSLWFIAPHRPGSLHEALGHFAELGVNLTRIESRPARSEPWEYVFFVDLEGHQADEAVREALSRLAASVIRNRVLGSYPRAARNGRPAAAPRDL